MENADAYGGFADDERFAPRSSTDLGIVRWFVLRLKTLLGWIIFQSQLFRLFWRHKAVIVVFHRVNDSYPADPITVTARDFERFVRFFAQFFDVIPLSDLLKRLESGKTLPTSLTITFDDGYWGNATIAAPILERYGLPACFFLATRYIGSDYVPPWDKHNGIDTKWMSWDQARALRAAGHEIGSHTETHVDLGIVSTSEARSEITGGIRHLSKEMGEVSGLFAYPFGQRRNMSEENQSLLRDLGLRCSLSAHGGTVVAGDDPLRLKRVNISTWFRSPYQFGFELVTRRLERD